MKWNTVVSLSLLVVGFLAFTFVNNMMLGGARLDLTENNLYTLSDGTKEIIDGIDEPVNLYFFFSEKVSEDLTSLRAYAKRVQDMLEEYKLAGGSKINLQIIDPESFSEEEDQAAEYGLQSVPVNQSGDALYFGLVGSNALDGEQVISFFQPDRERFLEYELTKLIYNLAAANKPRVGIYSDLPIEETVDPRTYQPQPGWVFVSQLEELFQVETLESLTMDSLLEIDLLVVVHPKELSELSLFAIDQHVLSGGKLIAFVDPIAEMDRPENPGVNMPSASSSDLNALTQAWGVKLRENEVLGDSEVALMVAGADGTPIRHFGILGFTNKNFSSQDVVTSSLESINMATAGFFDVDDVAGITVDPLIVSSTRASPLPALQFQFLTDPADLQKGFLATGETYSTAVRISGAATTAFPDGVAGYSGDLIGEATDIQVVLFADTDVLSDRLWVQVQNFFGQQIASAFADNGSLITNLVDNLSGSSALIDVRSRGQFTRPFSVVQELRLNAEMQYLQSEEDLQQRLSETERKLTELESSRVEDGLLTLSSEQEDALIGFQEEKLRIRKELREVRHGLDKDIEGLGSRLKFLNILLMPLILTGILLAFRVLRLTRRVDA